MLEPNPDFARQFFGRKTAAWPTPFKMPEHKTPGTRRIFVLGESAAAGTPDPAYSFSRMLEVMLRRQFPEARFEVCNVAMRGIDSPIIRHIVRECARYEPDLFLVYVGNNDVIALHGPQPGVSRWSQNLTQQRLSQQLKSTRIGQWLFRRFRGANEYSDEQDLAYFRAHRLPYDDWSRDAVVRNYAANLDDIVQTARKAGAKVALATVPVNVRGCPPLGSLSRTGLSAEEAARWTNAFAKGIEAAAAVQWPESIRQFTEASRIDDHFAELQFRLGEAYAAAGDTNQARTHFMQALDRDALQFRSDSRINAAIRQNAAQLTNDSGVRLVDAERAFGDSPLADGGVPGDRLFNDHVHPTFAGDHLLASLFFGATADLLGLNGVTNASPRPLLSRDECAKALAFTPWDEMNVEAAMTNFKSRPPHLDQADHVRRQQAAEASMRQRMAQFDEAALRGFAETYRAATEARPDDWLLRLNFGRLLLDARQFAEAGEQFEAAVRLQPRSVPLRLQLADALVRANRPGDVLRHLHEAQRLAPDDAQIPQFITRVQTMTSPIGPKQGANRGGASR
jgi:lysophospholipase L1-like esterase